jgi:hypothetical protein
VTGHYSGVIHNDKGDFFDRIQSDLIKTYLMGKQQESGYHLSVKGEDDYNQWLRRPTHKAFAVSTNGHYGYSYSKTSESEASTTALESCARYSNGASCKLIMVE